MQPTVQLVNARLSIVDLSMVHDILGKPVVLRPMGHDGDRRECYQDVLEHPHIKAVLKAAWVRVEHPHHAAPASAPVETPPTGDAPPQAPVPASAPVETSPAEDAPPQDPVPETAPAEAAVVSSEVVEVAPAAPEVVEAPLEVVEAPAVVEAPLEVVEAPAVVEPPTVEAAPIDTPKSKSKKNK